MINVYVTNLGKYNEGELIGEWVSLPIDEDEMQAVHDRIGINEEYEEVFLTDYETDVNLEIDEYESIELLNDYAAQVDKLEEYEKEIIAALIGDGRTFDEAMDKYEDCIVYDDCYSMGDVAYRMYEEGLFCDTINDFAARYIDWDALGRDIEFKGSWIPTDTGYIEVLY